MADEFTVLGEYGPWQKLTDKDPEAPPFFFNPTTDESSWDTPRVWGWVPASEGTPATTASDKPARWTNELTGVSQYSDPEWQFCTDESSGTTFWFNEATDESLWEPPDAVDEAEFSAPEPVGDDSSSSVASGGDADDQAEPRGDADSEAGSAAPRAPSRSSTRSHDTDASSRTPRAARHSLNALQASQVEPAEASRGSIVALTIGDGDDGDDDAGAQHLGRAGGTDSARPPPVAAAAAPSPPELPQMAPAPEDEEGNEEDQKDDEEAAELRLAADGTDSAGRVAAQGAELAEAVPDAAAVKALKRQGRALLTPASLGAAFPLLRRAVTSEVSRAAATFRTVVFRPGDTACVRGALATAGLGAVLVVRGRLRLIGAAPGATVRAAPAPAEGGEDASAAPPAWEPRQGEVVTTEAGPGDALATGAMLNTAFRYQHTVVALPPDPDEDGDAPGAGLVVLLCSDAVRVSEAMPQRGGWLLSRARALLADDPMLLAVYLHQIPFLRRASRRALAALIRRAVLLRKPPRQRLILEGTLGDAFYVLLHGSVAITIRGERIAQVGAGGFFGEMSLLRDADAAPASATVTTGEEECLLLCQPRTAFLRTLEQAPELRASIQRHVVRRSAQQARLLRVGCLAALDDRQLRRLFALARPITVPPRTPVVERGTANNGVLVVTQGTLEVTVSDPEEGRDRSLRVGTGAVVGVDALCDFRSQPRRLDVETGPTTGAQVVRFSRRDLVTAVGDDGALLAGLELSILRERATLPHLVRVPAARKAFLRFCGDIPPEVLDFVARTEAFARRAIALAPAPDAAVPVPPDWLVALAVYICDAFLGGAGPGAAPGAGTAVRSYVPHAVADRVVRDVKEAARGFGSGLRPDTFDACSATVASLLEAQRSDFVTDSAFQGLLRMLDKGEAGWLTGDGGPGSGAPGSGSSSSSSSSSSSVPSRGATSAGATPADRIVAGAVLVPAAHPITEIGRGSAPPSPSSSSSASSAQPSSGGGLRRAASRRALAIGSRSVTSAPFDVSQRTRLGQWSPRTALFHLERSELILQDASSPGTPSPRTAGSRRSVSFASRDDASARRSTDAAAGDSDGEAFPLMDVTRVEVHSEDAAQRQLSVHVRDGGGEREVVLRFDDSEACAAFCTLAHLIEPDVEVSTTGERYDHSGVSLFAIRMPTRAGSVARVLAINRQDGSLVRARSFDTADAGKPVPLGPGTRIVPSFPDPTRVRVLPHAASEADAFEAVFPTTALRDRFVGLLRIIVEGLDVSAARVLGLQRCGWAPPSLFVWCGTFNCGDAKPPKDSLRGVAEWLAPHRYDLYAVALQECSHVGEWAKTIESALRPATTAGTDEGLGQRRGGRPFRPARHELVASETLWGIHLLVFAREEVARDISNVRVSSVATGVGGVMGNKGGVAVGLVYRGVTSLAFVSCHLAARMGKAMARAGDFADIVRGTHVHLTPRGSLRTELLHDYDHVFWAGDLNFRVDMGKQGTAEEFARVQAMIAGDELQELSAHDELGQVRADGAVFGGFEEGALDFAPTYRLLKGTQPPKYSNKKNQNASWTDRVLWRSAASKRGAVMQLFYDATFALCPSDHRPVSAGFQVTGSMPYFHLEHAGIPSLPGRLILQPLGLRLVHGIGSPDQAAALESGLDVDLADLRRPVSPPEGRPVVLAPAGELYVTFASSLLPDVVTSGIVPVDPGYPGTAAAASWSEGVLPAMQPVHVDPDYLRHQHIVVAVRTRKGQLVGQAELPLASVFGSGTDDVPPGELTLSKVLERPALLRAFAAHVRKERSGENIDFWLEVQDFVARLQAHVRLVGATGDDDAAPPPEPEEPPSPRRAARPRSLSHATQRSVTMSRRRLERLRDQASHELLSTRARAARRERAAGDTAAAPAPPRGISAKAAKLLGAGAPTPSSSSASSSSRAGGSFLGAAPTSKQSRAASKAFAMDAERRRSTDGASAVTDLRRTSLSALVGTGDEDGEAAPAAGPLAPVVPGGATKARAASAPPPVTGTGSATRPGTAAAAPSRALPSAEELTSIAETARAVFDEYVDPAAAPAMVNLPAKIASVAANRVRSLTWAAGLPGAKPPVRAGSAPPPTPEAEAARWTWERLEGLFSDASAEVFRLMATDSFPRFLPLYKARSERLAAGGGGAYVGLPLLRHGIPAGYLTGQIRVTSLDNVAAVADRLATVDRCVAQKREQRDMVMKSRRRLLVAATGDGDDEASDDSDAGDGEGAGGASRLALARMLDGGDADGLDIESDAEEDLMARLVMSSSSRRAAPRADAGAGDAGGAGARRGTVVSDGPDAGDVLSVQVERALAEAGGSREALDLRMLLKLTYTRMRAAERRLARVAKSTP